MDMDERTANQRTELLTAINGLDAAVSVPSLLRILNVSHVDHAAVVTTAQALHAEGLIGRIPVAPPTGSYFAYFPLHLLSEALPVSLPQNLTTEQALAVLERAGWKPEPEVVTIEERRVADRRAPRYGVMDVVDRWRLPFRLSRIIEVIGGARNRKLTRDDAALVIRMIREHVRGAE